ncbi:MAG: M42 family metallopeptidase [Chloroflexota bacterium]
MWLKKLSEAVGVAGREDQVRQIVLEAIADRVDSYRVDTIGNVIAVKKGDGSSRLKVMIAAHMDEVGFMVSQIEENGLLHFFKVGGLDDRVLPAQVVWIGDDRVPGVIGLKPVHLSEESEWDRPVEYKQLTIDIGASSKAEAEKLVSLGDFATFATEFIELDAAGENWRTVRGKAFDDRAGCAVLIELLANRYPFDLYGVFTVQEELGLRGARVAAYAVEPDFAFALEGTAANELPTKKDLSPSTRLGHGPAITIMDRSFIADQRLVRLLIDTAETQGIPYQIKQPGIGGTDAGAIHRTKEGVPSVTVAVPCRYIHAPAAILSLNDLEHTVKLLHESLLRLPERVGA